MPNTLGLKGKKQGPIEPKIMHMHINITPFPGIPGEIVGILFNLT